MLVQLVLGLSVDRPLTLLTTKNDHRNIFDLCLDHAAIDLRHEIDRHANKQLVLFTGNVYTVDRCRSNLSYLVDTTKRMINRPMEPKSKDTIHFDHLLLLCLLFDVFVWQKTNVSVFLCIVPSLTSV